MKRDDKSQSPMPEDLITHYSSGYETNRLEIGEGKIDRERTRELLERFLPQVPNHPGRISHGRLREAHARDGLDVRRPAHPPGILRANRPDLLLTQPLGFPGGAEHCPDPLRQRFGLPTRLARFLAGHVPPVGQPLETEGLAPTTRRSSIYRQSHGESIRLVEEEL